MCKRTLSSGEVCETAAGMADSKPQIQLNKEAARRMCFSPSCTGPRRPPLRTRSAFRMPASPASAALPLVELVEGSAGDEQGKFRLNPEAAELLASWQEDIVVVAIAGA